MKSIKSLALAAVFAAGTSAFGLAEEAAPDSIANHEPIFGTYSATAPAGYVPQTVTIVETLQVPASPWVASRFNLNRGMTAEESFFLRAEAENPGAGAN